MRTRKCYRLKYPSFVIPKDSKDPKGWEDRGKEVEEVVGVSYIF
jgi:hypothetical protein